MTGKKQNVSKGSRSGNESGVYRVVDKGHLSEHSTHPERLRPDSESKGGPSRVLKRVLDDSSDDADRKRSTSSFRRGEHTTKRQRINDSGTSHPRAGSNGATAPAKTDRALFEARASVPVDIRRRVAEGIDRSRKEGIAEWLGYRSASVGEYVLCLVEDTVDTLLATLASDREAKYTLPALSRVCKTLYRATAPHLYRSIRLDVRQTAGVHGFPDGTLSFVELTTAIKDSPRAFKHVREMYLKGHQAQFPAGHLVKLLKSMSGMKHLVLDSIAAPDKEQDVLNEMKLKRFSTRELDVLELRFASGIKDEHYTDDFLGTYLAPFTKIGYLFLTDLNPLQFVPKFLTIPHNVEVPGWYISDSENSSLVLALLKRLRPYAQINTIRFLSFEGGSAYSLCCHAEVVSAFRKLLKVVGTRLEYLGVGPQILGDIHENEAYIAAVDNVLDQCRHLRRLGIHLPLERPAVSMFSDDREFTPPESGFDDPFPVETWQAAGTVLKRVSRHRRHLRKLVEVHIIMHGQDYPALPSFSAALDKLGDALAPLYERNQFRICIDFSRLRPAKDNQVPFIDGTPYAMPSVPDKFKVYLFNHAGPRHHKPRSSLDKRSEGSTTLHSVRVDRSDAEKAYAQFVETAGPICPAWNGHTWWALQGLELWEKHWASRSPAEDGSGLAE